MMALSALCVTWKERAPDTAVIEMGLEDKMERTRRDFWICFLLWASWHLPRFCKWQLEHPLCSPTPCVQPQLCRTHSFFAKCFQFEDISVFYFKEKKKKEKSLKTFWTKTHSRNSPESLRLFSFDCCGYATLGGTARIVDGLLCIPPLITVGTNVMGTLNQELYLGWVLWGSGM